MEFSTRAFTCRACFQWMCAGLGGQLAMVWPSLWRLAAGSAPGRPRALADGAIVVGILVAGSLAFAGARAVALPTIPGQWTLAEHAAPVGSDALIWLAGDRSSSGMAQAVANTSCLPLVFKQNVCSAFPPQHYVLLSADPPGPHIPAAGHPDYNLLAVRGYAVAQAHLGLVHYDGPRDPSAPQFRDLFADRRLPAFGSAYRANAWDWLAMRPGPPVTSPPVTVLALATAPGEILHVPDSGYTIGSGAEVLVLFAAADRVTLKYTRDDNTVRGYALHLEGICTDPALLVLYEQCNAAGRALLPALRPRQPFARAAGGQIILAIADTGSLMDPRSQKDWWQAY